MIEVTTSDAFIGEIRAFAFAYVPGQQATPQGQPLPWAQCSGAALPVSQYTALYGIIGTVFGTQSGSVVLPNMSNRAPIGAATGLADPAPGASAPPDDPATATSRIGIGTVGGSMTATVPPGALPYHNHAVTTQNVSSPFTNMTGTPGSSAALSHPVVLNSAKTKYLLPAAYTTISPGANATGLNPATLSQVGGGQPHDNSQPWLGLNFCIALTGIYPS